MTLLTAGELTALEALARRLRAAPGRRAGVAARPVAGHGTELYGHEPWRDGLDARHLDVQARLRTRAWWVRTFHDEGEPQVVIAVDMSASMSAKLPAARRLAAALSFLCAARLHPVSEHALDGPLPEALRLLAATARRADRVVVVSDLAEPTPPGVLLAPLASLARRVRVEIVHTRATSDACVPAGARELRSLEGVSIDRRPVEAGPFAAAVRAWQTEVERAAKRLGMLFFPVAVDDPFDPVVAARDIASWS